jgi:hypothetical protein
MPAGAFFMPITLIERTQNPDGGWPYVRGGSWTEPTAYAVMALLAAGETGPAERGLRWLRAAQRSDGGFPPQMGVGHSAWVTALAALVPAERLGLRAHARAIEWLLGASGSETTFSYRVREWLLGNAVGGLEDAGWAWAPDAAAWVGPTSLAILALEKERLRRPSAALRGRVECGRRFLLTRMCRGGGWNYGNVSVMGQDLPPYPETTGMALAALRGDASPRMGQAVAVATQFLAECRSADALNWLRLGLLAHGRLPEGYCPPARIERRTILESALDELVSQPNAGGLLGA